MQVYLGVVPTVPLVTKKEKKSSLSWHFSSSMTEETQWWWFSSCELSLTPTVLSSRKVKVAHLCPTLCNPMDYTVHGLLQAGTLDWLAFPFSRCSFQPRDRTQVSCTAGGFFTSWATREAQEYKYWSGSLSLLQQIFPTQEWNRGLLHCRRILYQLSYKGSLCQVE